MYRETDNVSKANCYYLTALNFYHVEHPLTDRRSSYVLKEPEKQILFYEVSKCLSFALKTKLKLEIRQITIVCKFLTTDSW